MNTFHFNNVGEYLGTRQLGAKVREQLLPLIENQEEGKLVLDFTGVHVVANSFADECLGKLLLEMSLKELKRRTTFKGLDDMARQTVATVFRRRLASITAS